MGRGKNISSEIREVIVRLSSEGNSNRKIGETLGKSQSTVQAILQHYKDTGSVKEKPKKGRPRTVTQRNLRHLTSVVKKNRRKSSKEICALWNQGSNISVSVSTTKNYIKNLGFSYYKVSFLYFCIFFITSVFVGKRQTLVNGSTEKAAAEMGERTRKMDAKAMGLNNLER